MSETSSANGDGRSAGTLRRGLAVLELVGTGPAGGMSQSEIAQALDLPLPTVGRLCRTLAELEWLTGDTETRRFDLGPRCAGLAARGVRGLGVDVDAAMEGLNERFNEEVNLAILQGRNAIYLNSFPSRRALRVQSVAGSQIPAHCTAIGKALLAQLDDALVIDRMGPEPYEAMADRTVRTWPDLKAELDRIRAGEVSRSVDEYEVGLTGFAIAVPSQPHGQPGAISVAVPSIRCTPDAESAIVAELTALSRQWTEKDRKQT